MLFHTKMKNIAPHKPYQIMHKKIGHVTVIHYLGTHNKMKKYLVRCDCGNLHETYGKTLMCNGNNNSNYRCDKCRLDPIRIKKMQFIRFMNSKAYSSWQYMIKACYPKSGNVNRSINKKWQDFFEFLKDMKEPKDNECLFHVKQFGEYNNKTCKWADHKFVFSNVRYI